MGGWVAGSLRLPASSAAASGAAAVSKLPAPMRRCRKGLSLRTEMTQSLRGVQQLLAFSETAKRGNFAAASREIGCTPSTLAKAVRRLEEHLGVRLFHRTTRQVTLTDDGQR